MLKAKITETPYILWFWLISVVFCTAGGGTRTQLGALYTRLSAFLTSLFDLN